MENRIKMDDLGVPLFLETPISTGDRRISEPSTACPSKNHRSRERKSKHIFSR